MDLLKANDVAKRLAVSRAWVYEAARTGRIPAARIGGDDGPLRFVPDDIDRWLADARAEWSPGAPRRLRPLNTESADPPSRTSRRRRPRSKSEPAEQESLL